MSYLVYMKIFCNSGLKKKITYWARLKYRCGSGQNQLVNSEVIYGARTEKYRSYHHLPVRELKTQHYRTIMGQHWAQHGGHGVLVGVQWDSHCRGGDQERRPEGHNTNVHKMEVYEVCLLIRSIQQLGSVHPFQNTYIKCYIVHTIVCIQLK